MTITLTREEAQQVLDALDEINKRSVGVTAICLPAEIDDAMETLRAKLSAPEPEPVAYQCCEHGDTEWFVVSADAYCINPSRYKYRALYTAPPQREWVGLTDVEISQMEKDCLWGGKDFNGNLGYWAVYRSIEAKLKEKNNG